MNLNFAGHHKLWVAGVEHRDPSLENIMSRETENGKFGVLNDWDLSRICNADVSTGAGSGTNASATEKKPKLRLRERTGVVQFMALDLLTQEYWTGKARREYRHDLESFIWILPWVFLQYEQGKSGRSALLSAWSTGNYQTVRTEKLAFLQTMASEKAKRSYRLDWMLARKLLTWVRNLQAQATAEMEQEKDQEDQEDEKEENNDSNEEEEEGDSKKQVKKGPSMEEYVQGFWTQVDEFTHNTKHQDHFSSIRKLIPAEYLSQ